MLEFNEQHKSADLSAIKPKLERAKKIGKTTLCGILVASMLLFSGCGMKKPNESIGQTEQVTAIVFHDENAIIMDLDKYCYYGTTAQNILLYTTTGEMHIVSVENAHVIEGENSKEIAEVMARKLVGENGTLSYYEEIAQNNKTK